MKKRKLLALALAFTLALPTITPGTLAFAVVDQVNITVRDTTGTKGTTTGTSTFVNTTVAGNILKGDSYADISYTGSSANKLEYQIVSSPVTAQSALPGDGWTQIPLTGTVTNEDVVTAKPGFLNRRSYDVTMLPNISNVATWQDRDTVYRYPFAATEEVSTGTSRTEAAYGHYIDYFNYNNIAGKRYYSNTVFDALNGYGDLYPPAYDSNVKYQEASKFWGYIKVNTSGNYYLGIVSDDGSTGTITVNGVTKKFTNQFFVQGSTWNSDNTSIYLDATKYYPVYLEYFNWGGGARFQMFYSNSAFSSSFTNKYVTISNVEYRIPALTNYTFTATNGNTYKVYNNGEYVTKINNNSKIYSTTKTDKSPSNAVSAPENWFYPSYSLSPGEYANTTFAGASGQKLPTTAGDYYILYKATSNNGTVIQKSGSYGPFSIPGSAEVNVTKRAAKSDGSALTSIVAGSNFNIEYSLKPQPILATANFGGISSIYLTNVRLEDDLNADFSIRRTADTSFVIENNKFTYLLDNIRYNLSVDGKTYVPAQSEYLYTVPVSLNVVGSNRLISKDGSSKFTYSDPCSAANVTKYIDNVIMKATPKAPTVAADMTVPTNQDVKLTATFTDNPPIKQYRVGDTGPWLTYTTAVVATENGKFYFRGGDNEGNYSNITEYVVENIDKEKPNAPIITGAAPVNDKVSVSISYSTDSAVKEYQIGTQTGTWLPYTPSTVIEATANETVIYARGKDEAGNYSDVTAYEVNSIVITKEIAFKTGNNKADTSVTRKGLLTTIIAFKTKGVGIPQFVLISGDTKSDNLFANLRVKDITVTDDATPSNAYEVSKTAQGILIKAKKKAVASEVERKIKVTFNVNSPGYSAKDDYYTLQIKDTNATIKVRVVRTPRLY